MTKRQLKTKTEPINPVAKTPATKQATETARQRELTGAQQIICDEVADMLIHGGHQDDINNMIFAALGHSWNRRMMELVEDPKKRAEKVEELIRRDFPEWKAELTIEWKRNRQAKPTEQSGPKNASERVRSFIMDDLGGRFEAFIANGTPEEHRLMRDILMAHESLNRGRHPDIVEVPLGEAFTGEIDGPTRCYIKVPYKLVDQVEKYAQCLIAAERECKPAA